MAKNSLTKASHSVGGDAIAFIITIGALAAQKAQEFMLDVQPTTVKYLVNVPPVHCTYTLASARWDRNALVLALMKSTAPAGWIMRSEAEALADAIIAATDQDVVPAPEGVKSAAGGYTPEGKP